MVSNKKLGKGLSSLLGNKANLNSDKKMKMDENIQFTWSSQHQTLMNLINE